MDVSNFTSFSLGYKPHPTVGPIVKALPPPKPETVNVRDFGALGDGVDDTRAINAALARLARVGGKLVLPDGDYAVRSELVYGATVLKIEGKIRIVVSEVEGE